MNRVIAKKMCSSCERILSINQFYKSSISTDGYSYCCKVCADHATNSAKARIREEFLSGEREPWKEKKCSRCGKIKSAKEFNISRTSKSGLYSACKVCTKKARSAAAEKANKKKLNI